MGGSSASKTREDFINQDLSHKNPRSIGLEGRKRSSRLLFLRLFESSTCFLAHLSLYSHLKAGFAGSIKNQIFKKGKKKTLTCIILYIVKPCEALSFPEQQFFLIINTDFKIMHFLTLRCFLWAFHLLPRGCDPHLRHGGGGRSSLPFQTGSGHPSRRRTCPHSRKFPSFPRRLFQPFIALTDKIVPPYPI